MGREREKPCWYFHENTKETDDAKQRNIGWSENDKYVHAHVHHTSLILTKLHTANSFVELVMDLFKIPGVKYFLSRKVCQDPLELYFGCQRQVGGTHNNPNVKEFEQNSQMLRVANFCHGIVRSNCRGNEDLGCTNSTCTDNSIALQPLQRRSRKCKATKAKDSEVATKSIVNPEGIILQI